MLCVDELEARVQDGGKFEVKGLYMYVLHRGRCVCVGVGVGVCEWGSVVKRNMVCVCKDVRRGKVKVCAHIGAAPPGLSSAVFPLY